MNSISNKRMKTDSEDEFEMHHKQNAMSSKERARKHRIRKKEYYKNLEKENEELKEQIEKLNFRITQLEEKKMTEMNSSTKQESNGFQPKMKSFAEVKLPQISKLLSLISRNNNSSSSASEEK